MVCPPVRSIIHSLKLVDYLPVQAYKPCSISKFKVYSQLSLSRLRLSRITAYLEEKIWSLFQHRNLKPGYKILSKRGEIAHEEQFLPFSTIFVIYISN